MTLPVIDEIDSLLELDPATEFKRHSDGGGLDERIREWLGTPMGTVADLPAWGNNLGAFKFEPPSPDLKTLIQMSILSKMPRDVENLIILEVAVDPIEIDYLRVTIVHQIGIVQEAVSL